MGPTLHDSLSLFPIMIDLPSESNERFPKTLTKEHIFRCVCDTMTDEFRLGSGRNR